MIRLLLKKLINMDKKSPQRCNYRLCLVCSIMLNLMCVYMLMNNNYYNKNGNDEKELSNLNKRGGEEGEEVVIGSSSCSGHGRAYLDGFGCECNACFGGPHCSQLLLGCTLDADSGNPIFLEPFWMKNAAKSEIVVPGWHRMGYEYEDGSLISKALVLQILKLHQFTNNAIADNKYIIFGAGSTQLLNAAVHALSDGSHNSAPTKVVASIPYYPVYKSQTELFESKRYKFKGDTSLWKKKNTNSNANSSSTNFIEFVTSPNNPDGQLKKAILKGSSVKRIHDLAYYWPHYTPIPAPLDEDLMIFTLSKLTGHSGSRFGWALIKDKDVYERMLRYVDVNTYGVARETQLRVLKLIKVVLEEEEEEEEEERTNGTNIFEFGYETMKNRWHKLSNSLSMSKRFSIQDLPPQYCTFSQIVRSPSPAFAWIKCEREEDKDCYKVLREGKIKGRAGIAFGAEKSYVRLSLCKSNDDFDLLLQRMEKLAYEEKTKVLTKLIMPTLILGANNKTIEIRNCCQTDGLYSLSKSQRDKKGHLIGWFFDT